VSDHEQVLALAGDFESAPGEPAPIAGRHARDVARHSRPGGVGECCRPQFWIDGTLTLQRDEFPDSGDLARSNLSALVQASLIQNAPGSQFVSLFVSEGRDRRGVVAAGGDSFTRLYSAGNTLQTAIFDTLVGNTLKIGGQIRVIATSGAGTSAWADFLNSAHLTLRGLTSTDLRFTGIGSNRDYGVVPAPGGLVLLLTALGGIAVRRRRG
jgi:hypothetical protein